MNGTFGGREPRISSALKKAADIELCGSALDAPAAALLPATAARGNGGECPLERVE
jgi:hypothetical protein